MSIAYIAYFDPTWRGAFEHAIMRYRILNDITYTKIINLNENPQKVLYKLLKYDKVKLYYLREISKTSFLLLLKKLLYNHTIIVEIAGDSIEYNYDFLYNVYYKIILNKCNMLILSTNSLKKYIFKRFNLVKKPYNIIPNVVLPKDIFYNNINYKNNENKKIIYHIGRLDQVIIEIFERLQNYDKDLHFIFIGIPQINLNKFKLKNITIIPYLKRNKIYEILSYSKLFIVHYPSWYLTIPHKLVDYMYAGRPIITNEFACLREILSEEEAYILPNKNFIEQAASIALKILSNKMDDATDKANKARQKAIELFSYEKVKEKMYDTLKQFL
jgi:glycosyltransferase involved in cell wall biosynthesis